MKKLFDTCDMTLLKIHMMKCMNFPKQNLTQDHDMCWFR